jgi:hypothetical protein
MSTSSTAATGRRPPAPQSTADGSEPTPRRWASLAFVARSGPRLPKASVSAVDRVAQHLLLDVLGCQAGGSGQARLAARLLGAAETVRTGVGASVMPV